MINPRVIISCILLFTCRILCAQVAFTQIPVDFQLIPRNAFNMGTFTVSGKSAVSGYPRLITRLTDVLTGDILEDKSTGINTDGSFTVAHQIPACLKEYDLTVYVSNGFNDLPVKTVRRLVSGDCFIICGQSNGMAAANWDDTSYSLPYLRGIGSNEDPQDPGFPCSSQDLKFTQSNPAWLQGGFVGAWGMRLQHDLALETGIPSCLVNGSKGGSSIRENLPSRTPSDINAIDTCIPYDRLFQKIAHNHLNAAIRVLFWYQGETDGDSPLDTTCRYMERFHRLYTAWKTDYPNLERVIIMQVNMGCTQTNLGLLRDMQRMLADVYSDVITMSTFSSDSTERTNDNCHYTFKGYNNLAGYLLPMMKKQIYNYSLNDIDFMPPKILKVYPSDSLQLCLEFNVNVSVQQSRAYNKNIVEYIKDYFYGEGDSRLNVLSVTSKANRVFLDFPPGTVLPKRLTYLPQSLNNAHTVLYLGPYIVNANKPKVTALSFSGYPVSAKGDNNWLKAWSNSASSRIDEHKVDKNTAFYTGDFNGDGADELLCVGAANGPAFVSLLNYNNGVWNPLWADKNNVLSGNAIYNYRNNIITGDFDGDGKDELFGKDDNGSAALFKFLNNSWQLVWTDNNNADHIVKQYGYKLYAGDFDGNGTDELIGFDGRPDGKAVVIGYHNSDFIAGSWQSYPWHKIIKCKDNLIAADFDGDGRTDLLGLDEYKAYTLFVYNNNDWECTWNNNADGTVGNFNYLQDAGYKIIAGNIDGDPGDELILLQKTQAAFMKFKEGNWNKYWSVEQAAGNVTALNDWNLELAEQGNARYCFLKAKSPSPGYLLATREENCTYLVNLYKTGSPVYKQSTLTNYNSTCGQSLISSHEFLAYPNPARDLVTLKLYDKDQHATVSLFDSQGRLVIQLNNQDSNIIELNVRAYEKGVYLIKLNTPAGSSVKKIVLQ